ncbi:MAG: hypothetical protein HQ512_02155 [Rhodospirillales bacterium]|nr:hypothetical protein [Rhodospirillales bacterium]
MNALAVRLRLSRLVVLFSIVFSAPSFAQETGGEWGIDVRGFALGNFSGRTTGQLPPGSEGRALLLGEERLRLDLTGWTDAVEAQVRVKLDGVHDAVTGDLEADLREAYFDYTAGDLDFRLGRQIATWGVGDLLFINDVFPKNWVSFFSGRPLEYLKNGIDGLRVRYSANALNGELVLIPRFRTDTLPTSKRFFLHDDYASVTNRDEDLPDTTLGNTEIGLRLYRRFGGFDVSGYAYRGRWRSPGQRADNASNATQVTSIYPPLSVYGLSAQGQGLGGVLTFEGGYYDSRDDRDGDDIAVPNSQTRFLAGYQKELWKDFTLGAQYYTEILSDFDAYKRTLPNGFARKRKYRNIVTVRLTQFLMHQTWKLSLFAFYSPAESDYLLQPQITYKFSDNLSAALGGNVFGGEERTTFFGQFDQDDNAYINLRYDF